MQIGVGGVQDDHGNGQERSFPFEMCHGKGKARHGRRLFRRRIEVWNNGIME
jgi:hypothetical protein